jgi:hypothetical protein
MLASRGVASQPEAAAAATTTEEKPKPTRIVPALELNLRALEDQLSRREPLDLKYVHAEPGESERHI